jgi:hypothetical protein
MAHQKQIFVGKLDGELWASEQNDLRAAILTGFWARARRRVFGQLRSAVKSEIHLSAALIRQMMVRLKPE